MAQAVSIVIPNYNGYEILKENLPIVIKNSPSAEIIVVDDASTDKSVSLIHKHFKKIRLIRLKNNLGFAGAVNKGIQEAKGEYVVLLNSDVSPRNNYIKNSLKHFKLNKYKNKLFAVGFLDYSHEGQKLFLKGKGQAKLSRGMFIHSPAKIERGHTLWVSGGSGIFKRDAIIKLGGFDSIYAPFYWEDIDLAYRAWKHGYICIFEPLAVVDHYHEKGAILKNTTKQKIRTISFRNQLIFTWKNIDDYTFLIKHLVNIPYLLFSTLIKRDVTYLAGFLTAIVKIPQIVLNSYNHAQTGYVTSKKILDESSR